MKVVLTGIDSSFYLPGYFGFKTLLAKIGGLIFGNGAGLIIGTEGAFVHIMAMVTNHLLRLKFFRNLNDRLSIKLQLLAASCAVAVSSTFASPIGGVLFSIEVTATYYLISNYMKAFISSVCAAVMVLFTKAIISGDYKSPQQVSFITNFPNTPINIFEIPLAVILGKWCHGLRFTTNTNFINVQEYYLETLEPWKLYQYDILLPSDLS